MYDEKGSRIPSTPISVNAIEFFGLFLAIIGMLIAIFSPRMGTAEGAMAMFGYIIIGVGVVAILSGCILSVFIDRRKKDIHSEAEAALPNSGLPMQLIPRRCSIGISSITSAQNLPNINNFSSDHHQHAVTQIKFINSEQQPTTSYPEEPPPSYYDVVGIQP